MNMALRVLLFNSCYRLLVHFLLLAIHLSHHQEPQVIVMNVCLGTIYRDSWQNGQICDSLL